MTSTDHALISAIGERVRARRQARGWTLDDLAERSGVSRRMLVSVEQGATNASIATLLRLSEALGIGLPALVAPGDGDAPVQVTRAGTRHPLWATVPGGSAHLVASVMAPDVVELWDWVLAPGDAHASEPHRPGTRELVHVIEGALLLLAAATEVALGPGDAAVFPGDAVHGYRNDGPAPVRFALTVYEPATLEARR